MRLSSRSYPYPAVGDGDDVPEAAFQATFEYSSDQQFYYISVTAACSSTTLLKLISKESASYVLHVECSNTLFRKAYDFTGTELRAQIPAYQLNDAVEVNAFIRATKDIASFKVAGAHEDYGDNAFFVRSGDILAVGEGQVFYAENSFDSLRRIGSIMVIEQSTESADHPMRVEYNSEKIRILLCENDFKAYSKLKGIPTLTSHLTTTIVLPVLLEALHYINEDDQGMRAYKWYRVLESRIEVLELQSEQDVLAKAQKLLDMPIRRALAAAESYAAGAAS
jgi:hypothetical protein